MNDLFNRELALQTLKRGHVKVLLAFLVVEVLFLFIFSSAYKPQQTISTQAQSSESPLEAEINQDVLACKQLPPTDRPACARAIGQKISSLFPSAEDRIRQCIKLRPLLVRYCQEGLLNAN